MKSNWLSILMQDCIRYKKPSMINLLEFDEFPSDFNLNR